MAITEYCCPRRVRVHVDCIGRGIRLRSKHNWAAPVQSHVSLLCRPRDQMRTYRVFYEPCEPWQDAWKLDIERIVFVGANGAEVRRSSVICSGSCDQTGYAAENAFEENAMVWGGRGHPTSHRIWLGITTDDIVVDCRIIADAVGAHLTLQERVADHTWRSLRRWRIDDSVGGLTETPTWVSEWQLFGLTAEPSDDRPLETVGDLHDVCYRGLLMAPRPAEFTGGDPSFYQSVNCEGLWVCCSQAAGPVLPAAVTLIRACFSPAARAACATFRSPIGSAAGDDPGPMRLVILDDRTNENLCQIPEFVGKKEGRHRVEDGRNCTCCPFIFSSREDLVDGVGGWPPGALTCHEVFHGVDMAIRQKDPAFHWKVADAYERHKARGTLGSIYASTNRDEYMAEMVVVYCGLSTDELTEVGLRDRQTLRDMAPEAFALIEGYIANSQ